MKSLLIVALLAVGAYAAISKFYVITLVGDFLVSLPKPLTSDSVSVTIPSLGKDVTISNLEVNGWSTGGMTSCWVDNAKNEIEYQLFFADITVNADTELDGVKGSLKLNLSNLKVAGNAKYTPKNSILTGAEAVEGSTKSTFGSYTVDTNSAELQGALKTDLQEILGTLFESYGVPALDSYVKKRYPQ